jgi:hypothetical protein
MRATIWLCALGLLAGCREKLEEVEKPYRAKLEARLAEVERIGQALAKLPLLDKDDETIAIAAAGGAIGSFGEHFAFMYAEAFADLSEHGAGPPPELRLVGANPMNLCASFLRKRRCPPASAACSCAHSAVTSLYQRCLALRYLFVVRTLEYGEPGALVRTTPELGVPDQGRAREASTAVRADAGAPAPARGAGAGADAGARAEAPPDARARDLPRPDTRARDLPPPDRGRDRRVESFTYPGGLLRAEVHVYEIAGAKRLGGFRVEVRSPEQLPATYVLGNPLSAASSAGSAAQSVFRRQCLQTLTSQVRARIPNSVVRAR